MSLFIAILFSILVFLLGIILYDWEFTRKEFVIFIIGLVFIILILILTNTQMNFC